MCSSCPSPQALIHAILFREWATYHHSGEKQKTIKKDHMKEFGGRNAPEASQQKNSGTSQGHPGRLGRFMWKFQFTGQNVRGTDGTYDGTDGTCPWDRRDTHQGVSLQKYLCLLVFFFPQDSCLPDTPSIVRSPIVGSEKALPPSLVTATMLGLLRSFFCLKEPHRK